MSAPVAVRERPILFTGEMVRAILDGRKTVTRRPVKLTDAGRIKEPRGNRNWHPDDPEAWRASPYGVPGDRLWVRETFGLRTYPTRAVEYAADCDLSLPHNWHCWKSPIHMPRWASRLVLDVVSVRVERLQEITPDEALREGLDDAPPPPDEDPAVVGGYGSPSAGHFALDRLRSGWDRLYRAKPERQWTANPWVWRIEFRVHESRS